MNLQSDDHFEFERLIDGELSFAEQKDVLSRLDAVPDGWRRLALGLLEDQAFRRELQRVDHEPAAQPISLAAQTLSGGRGWTDQREGSPGEHAETGASPQRLQPRPPRHTWLKPLAMAAACLVCVGIGMQAEQLRGGKTIPSPAIAATTGPTKSTESVPIKEDAPADAALAVKSIDTASLIAESERLLSQQRPDPSQPKVKIVFADWPTPMEIPVVELADGDVAKLLEWSALPEDVREEWESAGYLIYEDKKYVPIALEDGRQAIAPISDIVVEYIGTGEYQ